jgi:hypothetical protein
MAESIDLHFRPKSYFGAHGLEALADQFNATAGQLQESYAGLEKKVEERTHELETRSRGPPLSAGRRRPPVRSTEWPAV